jgi:ribosomal protein S18 acetylase RimI-like enzyme
MTPHLLDNPAWNALSSGNRDLALGTDDVKFFPEDVSPFAGLKRFNKQAFHELFSLISPGRPIIIPSTHKLQIPGYWKIIREVVALQMIFNKSEVITKVNPRIVSLSEKDIPQMIALTQLTEPGPFLQRTIEFGNYKGIFNSGELIAMAGQRMHSYNYVEISAVCTHPDHTGNGYARSLMNDQVRKIVNEGNIPFLHVRDDNKHAIELYKRIGFTVRTEMNIYVLQKES